MNMMDTEVLPILDPAADAAGRSSRYISLKNFTGPVKLVAYINQGNAATVAITPLQASAVAGTGAKAIVASPIVTAQDLATTTVGVRQTAAASFTTSAALTAKRVEFIIDPASFDVAGGFDCIGFTTGASNVANITAGFVVATPRYSTELGSQSRAD